MVEQGTKATDTQQLSQSREAVHERFSQDTLKENLGKLSRFGGFSFLESAIDRVQNLNPDRKARMSIYLKDEDKRRTDVICCARWICGLKCWKRTAQLMKCCPLAIRK